MKIIDTVGIDFMVKNSLKVEEVLYITPDVQEEFETGHGTLPRNIKNLFDMGWFKQGVFLNSYRKMLNLYRGRSFYSMRGFGDISILAALDERRVDASHMIPGLSGPLEIITGDKGLTNKIKQEFLSSGDTFGATVTVITPEIYFGT